MPCARVRAVGFGGLAASPSQDPGVPPPLAGLGPPTQKGSWEGRAGAGGTYLAGTPISTRSWLGRVGFGRFWALGPCFYQACELVMYYYL